MFVDWIIWLNLCLTNPSVRLKPIATNTDEIDYDRKSGVLNCTGRYHFSSSFISLPFFIRIDFVGWIRWVMVVDLVIYLTWILPLMSVSIVVCCPFFALIPHYWHNINHVLPSLLFLGATFGTGITAIKLTALGRPQLLVTWFNYLDICSVNLWFDRVLYASVNIDYYTYA